MDATTLQDMRNFFGQSSEISDEEVEDRYAEAIFEIKDYLLRNPVLPATFGARIKRLEQLAELVKAPREQKDDHEVGNDLNHQADHPLEFLRHYSALASELKLSLAHSTSAQDVATFATRLLRLQYQYDTGMLHYFQSYGDVPAASELKLGAQTDTGALIKAVQQLEHIEADWSVKRVTTHPSSPYDQTIITEIHRIRKLQQLTSYKPF